MQPGARPLCLIHHSAKRLAGLCLLIAVLAGSTGCRPALRLEPDAVQQEIDAFRANAVALFLDRNFAELERISAEIRSTRARFGNGGWKLYQFHDAITYQDAPGTADARRFTSEEWALNQEINDAWLKAHPESITALVAWIKFQTYQARNRRHSKETGNTPESSRGFEDAAQALEAGLHFKEKSAMFWCAGMAVAQEQKWPREKVEAFWEQGKQHEPQFQMLDAAMGLYLRDEGNPGDIALFAAKELSRPGGSGVEGYARLATTLGRGERFFFRDKTLDWEIVKAGYEQMLKKYPDSRQALNHYALLAGMALDKPTAKMAFDQLQGVGCPSVWKELQYMEAFRDWLEGKSTPGE